MGFDAVLILGTRVFAYYPYAPGPYLPEGLRAFLVTNDPAEAARAPFADAVVGSARAAVAMLLDLVGADPARPSPPAASPLPSAEPGEPPSAAFVYKTRRVAGLTSGAATATGTTIGRRSAALSAARAGGSD